ncbi:MAG: DUF1295 domain-containing protein [Chloroflexi bacterium]|nr:DUF1295 domain-containing protein [Chloroflexota bacterium]
MNISGFWWILFVGFFYGLFHSVFASLKLKKLAYLWFGEKGRIYYRFFYVIFASITTFFYAILIVLLPDKLLYTVPAPWFFLTLSVQFAAVICLLLSFRGTGVVSFLGIAPLFKSEKVEKKSALITTGFYAITRHPIYFFSFVILWFFPIMTWNMLSFSIGITIYTLIGSQFEEQKLEIDFGQKYVDYKKKTPWIIPFIGLKK